MSAKKHFKFINKFFPFSAYQFISVHPSVLASACLYDVILHNVSPADRIVVLERLVKLTGVEKVRTCHNYFNNDFVYSLPLRMFFYNSKSMSIPHSK